MDASHDIMRPLSLLQAMNTDDLPDTVQIAFGDAPVREGGPVNSAMHVNLHGASALHNNQLR